MPGWRGGWGGSCGRLPPDLLRKQLRRARETELTPRQRQILTLYYEQGMNMAQIARKIGRDRSTVSRTMKRAREKLRRCLCYAL